MTTDSIIAVAEEISRLNDRILELENALNAILKLNDLDEIYDTAEKAVQGE